MPSYKNKGDVQIVIQAAANVERTAKKFYKFDPGQTIELPVELNTNYPNLELVTESTKKKKKSETDEAKN